VNALFVVIYICGSLNGGCVESHYRAESLGVSDANTCTSILTRIVNPNIPLPRGTIEQHAFCQYEQNVPSYKLVYDFSKHFVGRYAADPIH
jgi:hypothetical protein